MLLLYKLFLLFFLQQGVKAMDPKDNINVINMETVLSANDMTVVLKGDQPIIEHFVSICFLYDSHCEVLRESETKAKVVFKNLKYRSRNRIMERSRMIHDGIEIQWTENSLSQE